MYITFLNPYINKTLLLVMMDILFEASRICSNFDPKCINSLLRLLLIDNLLFYLFLSKTKTKRVNGKKYHYTFQKSQILVIILFCLKFGH